MTKPNYKIPKHPQLFLFDITPTNIHIHEATISVPTKTHKILKIEAEHDDDIQNLLRKKYIVENKSIHDIGKELKCNPSTVYIWMKKYNIPMRAKGIHRYGKSYRVKMIEDKYNIKIQDLLYRMYIVEENNIKEISRELGCGMHAVARWMKKSNITSRSSSERFAIEKLKSIKAIEDKYNENIKNLLHRLYIVERKSPEDICKDFGCSSSTIRRWIKQYKIPNRTHKEAVSTDAYKEKMKQRWEKPSYIQSVLYSINRSPNKPESSISEATPTYIVYTGNGSFWRTTPNGKHSNPDWIIEPIKKTRRVIFHHGIYWHRNELHNRGQDLINQWNKIGYECLIVWEDEQEEIILDKIKQFSAYQLELF